MAHFALLRSASLRQRCIKLYLPYGKPASTSVRSLYVAKGFPRNGNEDYSSENRSRYHFMNSGNSTTLCRHRLSTQAAASGTRTQSLKDFSEIPGPKPLPLIGNLLSVFTHKDFNPKNYYKFWEGFMKDYGPIAKLKNPGMPTMVASINPDDVETFLKATLQNPIREGFESLKQVRLAAKDNYFGNNSGLLPENGEEWWRLRSRVQVPLLRPRNVAMYLPAVDGATCMFMDRIDLLQKETGQVPDDFLQELYKWALESLLGTITWSQKDAGVAFSRVLYFISEEKLPTDPPNSNLPIFRFYASMVTLHLCLCYTPPKFRGSHDKFRKQWTKIPRSLIRDS